MKKKLKTLTIFTTFALSGIIFTQGYWIYRSIIFQDTSTNDMLSWLGLAIVFLIMVILGYINILVILFRQKKLSNIKNDFINNMTHEFKTPLSTIKVAGEMLLKSSVNEYPYKVNRYANIILDENNRIKGNVEQVLQLSVLDKELMRIKKDEVDIHEVIENLVNQFNIKIQNRHGIIKVVTNATRHRVFGDKLHITNVLTNLIDNAIKYSHEAPYVHILTENKNNEINVSISDEGIGISKAEQKNIFRKMYRVPTGNIHDVKGFGIGLYYVKTMVEAHRGKIELTSEENKGSTFILTLPLN